MVRIVRSYPAPASLAIESQKKNGNYSKDDVVNALITDFYGKCYICERNNLQAPVIEHLLPYKNGKFRDRMFDWDNLFLACSYCNGVKNKNKYDEGIIDCCKDDPEKNIEFSVESGKAQFKLIRNNPVNQRTIVLLDEVYNGPNTKMRRYVCSVLYSDLTEEMNAFYVVLSEYLKNDNIINTGALRGHLLRNAPFAAFKRWFIRKNYFENAELMEMVA